MPGKKYYEVKEILNLREGSDGLEFLVRWAHYTPAADSWEPAENLKYCGDIIEDFMEKQNKRTTRRSTRLSQANEQTKFEELPARKPRRKTHETTVTRTTKSTFKTKSKDKGAGNMSLLDQDASLHRYSTRSSSRQVDLSDEEDITTLSSAKPLKSRRPISESKFRKEIGGLVSSTPYSSFGKEKAKKALGFDEYDVQENVTVTTTIQTRSMDKKKSEEIMMGEADSEDDDEVTHPKQQQQQQQQDDGKSSFQSPDQPAKCASWMAIGWKEVALATVLTGIGVVGYVCYVTDYCSFC